jgi:type VI secretion system protein ImpC
LIEQVIGDVAVPPADPNRQLYFDVADELIGNRMREILHHPCFQALEAQWRSVEFLVDRLELDEELQLFVLDVTKKELIDDLNRAENRPDQSELFKLLVEQGVQIPGTEPWSLLLGNFRFGPSEQDVGLLSFLGSIASEAGGPFLAEAKPTVVGCNSLVEQPDPRFWGLLDGESENRWQVLRRSPAAPWIGLALPRLLLRLPYGTCTDEIEAFSFTELPAAEYHHGLLWGNPAFGCAFLIGQAFTQGGWTMGTAGRLDINDLPAYSYQENGESKLKPCAETLLSERAGEAMLASGLIPILSRRDSNSVRVLNLPSLSDPLMSLPTFVN